MASLCCNASPITFVIMAMCKLDFDSTGLHLPCHGPVSIGCFLADFTGDTLLNDKMLVAHESHVTAAFRTKIFVWRSVQFLLHPLNFCLSWLPTGRNVSIDSSRDTQHKVHITSRYVARNTIIL